MSDTPITGDGKVTHVKVKNVPKCGIIMWRQNILLHVFFVYLGDSERSRAPCTNNAQVKFTTKKHILRHRKNSCRGILERAHERKRQTGRDQPEKYNFIHKQPFKINVLLNLQTNCLCMWGRRKDDKEWLVWTQILNFCLNQSINYNITHITYSL